MIQLPADNTIAPILAVSDLAKALEIYRDVFGFERLRYFDGNDEYAVVGRGTAQLHLMAGKPNPHHVRGSHVADVFVWVDDLEPVVECARAKKLAITRGPESYDSTPIATTEVVIEDADGYWLCFGTSRLN